MAHYAGAKSSHGQKLLYDVLETRDRASQVDLADEA
jgi:hypothetical protein